MRVFWKWGLIFDFCCAIRGAEDRAGVVYKRGKEKGGLWMSWTLTI